MVEIMHHIAFNSGDKIESVLESFGIQFRKTQLPGGGNFLGTVEISEASPAWPHVSELIRVERPLDIAYTLYEDHEVLETGWVRFIINNERGYPQPEGGNRWEKISLTMRCAHCIKRYDQKAPYHVKREPKMGRFDFMSLYWTYVMFATPRVLAAFSQEGFRGYEDWPVIIHRTGEAAESVRQVYIPNETKPGLLSVIEPEPVVYIRDETRPGQFKAVEMPGRVCPECHYMLLDPVRRGPIRYRRDAFPEGVDFARSYEWFGGTPHQEIFVSHRVAKTIIENGWRGTVLQPVELI